MFCAASSQRGRRGLSARSPIVKKVLDEIRIKIKLELYFVLRLLITISVRSREIREKNLTKTLKETLFIDTRCKKWL